MAQLEQDRLVRKEVALGQVREIPTPVNYIGSQLAPTQAVQSDDVIFSYIAPDTESLAPARAEDAEAEMAQKDDTAGYGRASIIDWAIKDHYRASDVSRYREYLRLAELSGGGNFPLTVTNMTEDWQSQLARDLARRRRSLDNRLEWLAVQGAFEGSITYDDGKIKFTTDFGRPVGQQDQAAANGNWTAANAATMDPIADVITMNDYMYDTHGIRMTRAFASEKALRNLWYSDKFQVLAGLASGAVSSGTDIKYLIPSFGTETAIQILQAATGVTFSVYEGQYRTRPIGSLTWTWNRFADETKVLFLPPEDAINEVSDLGFGRMLTSPHPEGNWQPGFYEWERSTVDPWGMDRGNGVKAFPVYPHLEYSYVMTVL